MTHIVPRQYQVEAIRLAVHALEMTFRALVVMATGLGKTITSALIAREVKARRVLFLVHNNYILEKSMREYQKVFGASRTYALYNGLSKNGAEKADIVFATFQTMGPSISDWPKSHFDIVVVDESHHSHADTYRPTIEHFDALRLALTATPERLDLLDIRTLFGSETVNISLEEAIARGWLPQIEYHIVTDEGFDQEVLAKIANEVLEKNQRISIAELNRRVFVRAREEKVAEIIEGYGQKSLVFCETINHAEELRLVLAHAETFHSRKGTSVDDTWRKNQSVLQAFDRGIVRHVLAVDAFNEGIDAPNIGLVAFCRTTASERVFKQQLGRGLHSNLDKLIVLDFVGNVERIITVRKMLDEIARIHEAHTSPEDRNREGYKHDVLRLSGSGFEFTFSDKLVDLIKVLKRVTTDLYPTWQEASAAAIELSIGSWAKYRREYKKNPRLPSVPSKFYGDFPGFYIFLGIPKRKTKDDYYPTWKEASASALKLGLSSRRQYEERYKEDPRLPGSPGDIYPDFPGFTVFFEKPVKDFYEMWQEASIAAIRLGISSVKSYAEKYRLDARLPSFPERMYWNFPGYAIFLGGIRKDPYRTWQEASKAALDLGIKSQKTYASQYERDPRLPGDTRSFYKDFPGDTVFFGGKVKSVYPYKTWQEAGKAAVSLGITNAADYKKKYKSDSRLPAGIHRYYGDFPGMNAFLGTVKRRTPVDFYRTVEEASVAAIKLGLSTQEKYKVSYKLDPRLPSNPNKAYSDFTSWKKFLGKI